MKHNFPDLKEFLLKIEHNKIKIVIAGLDGILIEIHLDKY